VTVKCNNTLKWLIALVNVVMEFFLLRNVTEEGVSP
jgi:hypothetical protein